MKIRSTSRMLAALMEVVARAVSGRSTVPILQAVLLEAREGIITLSATDTEISMRASAAATVEEEGLAAIPARLLLRYVKSLPEGEIELTCSESEGKATLLSGKSAVELRSYPARDFPSLPSFPEGETESFEVHAPALARAAGKVLPFVSKDKSRPVLTGVLVAFSDGSVCMVATDSYRLGMCDERLDGAPEGAGSALVPARSLKEAARLAELAGEEGRVGVALAGNAAFFRGRGVTLSTRLIEGTFPEYTRLMPERFEKSFHANRGELLDALKRARLVAASSTQNPPVPVRLAFSPPGEAGTLGGGELTISLSAKETGASTEAVPAEVPEGEAFEASFNPDYLTDAISSLTSERVALRFNDPMKPAVVEAYAETEKESSREDGAGDAGAQTNGAAGHLCLIMPMRDPNGGNGGG